MTNGFSFIRSFQTALFIVLASGCDLPDVQTDSDRDSAKQNSGSGSLVFDSAVTNNSGGSATRRPVAPLLLAAPAAESGELGDTDLTKMKSSRLAGAALAHSRDNEFDDAVQLQYWSVQNGDGSDGLYNLACFYSLAGNSDASFYWLQQAAEKQGVDAEWADHDSDLQDLRDDPRWGEVRRFLREYNSYWGASNLSETTLVIPADYIAGTPIPVIVGLHGMGSRARHFVDHDFQTWADTLRVAFVGVSGTQPRGPTSFVWSEDPGLDLKRIDDAFDELQDRLTPKEGQIALFGFSQGAMMAAEIAARHPDRFAGALVMSPGGNSSARVADVTKSNAHAGQRYICVCGAGEAPGNVALTSEYARDLKSLGCQVEHRPYRNMVKHTFPPDFAERFPEWIAFMLQLYNQQ